MCHGSSLLLVHIHLRPSSCVHSTRVIVQIVYIIVIIIIYLSFPDTCHVLDYFNFTHVHVFSFFAILGLEI